MIRERSKSGRSYLTIIPLLSFLLASAAFTYQVYKDKFGNEKDSPSLSVLVTRDGLPAQNVELVSLEDGAQFSISPKDGYAFPSIKYTGKLFYIRDGESKKELTRFILSGGFNEIRIQ